MAVYVSKIFLLASIFTTIRAGDGYLIDNTNSTIRYTSNSTSSVRWNQLNPTHPNITAGNGTVVTFDYDRAYNRSLTCTGSFNEPISSLPSLSTGASCNTSLVCELGIPFTGSGITLYGLTPGDTVLNFTITIDGNPAPAPSLIVSPAETDPPLYNITLYDIRSLPLSFHFLVLRLVQYVTPCGCPSTLFFDYAYVNDTVISPSANFSSSATPTPSSVPHTRRNIGVIVGPIIAGVLLISALLILLYFRRRRTNNSAEQHHLDMDEPVPGLLTEPYTPPPVHGLQPLRTSFIGTDAGSGTTPLMASGSSPDAQSSASGSGAGAVDLGLGPQLAPEHVDFVQYLYDAHASSQRPATQDAFLKRADTMATGAPPQYEAV